MQICFARSHYLKDFRFPVYIRKFLTQSDWELEKKILSKWFQMISEGKSKNGFRIRNLQLYYHGNLVNLNESLNWLTTNSNCLLVNCQSINCLEKRLKLLKVAQVEKISLLFLTETWLDNQITDSEIFTGGSHTLLFHARTEKRWTSWSFNSSIICCVASSIWFIRRQLPLFDCLCSCPNRRSCVPKSIMVFPLRTSNFPI